MCKQCGKPKGCSACNGAGGGNSSNSLASTQALVATLSTQVDALSTALSFILKGHPEMVIEDVADIAAFNFTTGVGSGAWQGWAVCDGQSHTSSTNQVIATPNLINRFIVMSGGEYTVGNTGGSDTVVLSTPQLPAHAHTLTDPGHTHVVVDPGHLHAVTDPGHTHGLTDPGHTHVISPNPHGHSVTGVEAYTYVSGAAGPSIGQLDQGTNASIAVNNVSLTNSSDNTGIGLSAAFTGVSTNNAFTGISNTSHVTGITMANTGSGTAHENRPPYYAVVIVKYIG